MSGWPFLALGLFAAVVDFAVGLHLLRSAPDSLERAAAESEPAAQRRQLGHLLTRIVAPSLLAVFVLISFGIVPVGGIEPISFN